MGKVKRVINDKFVVLFATVLIIVISLFKIPSYITSTNLENLGYSDESIKAIKHLKLSKVLIDNEYYSDYLNSEISKDSFKKDYLELYLYRNNLTNDDFLLYDKLINKGYTKEEIIKLYKSLNFYELTPLLVFDKLDNLDTYINDCKKNSTTNSKDSLILNNDYLKAYQNVTDAKKIGSKEVLVTMKYTLNQYKPEKLVPLKSMYASEGVEIENEAYSAFIELWDDMMAKDLGIYALNGYRSYESQTKIYEEYGATSDNNSTIIKPGYAESQTGLDLTVVDSRNETLSNFENTEEYNYLKEHAHEFGFIIRYPENKTSITGYPFIPYQIRYVGKDIAKKVYESHLTYEEYYLLYLDEEVNQKDE